MAGGASAANNEENESFEEKEFVAAMPKMKSKSAAKKRFKLTASGQLKRNHCNHSHILTKKSAKRKRHLRQSSLVGSSDLKRVRRLLVG